MLGTAIASLLHQAIEMTRALLQQHMWMTQLHYTTCVQDHHPIRVHDRVQAMCDGQHGAVGEPGVNGLLNELIGAARGARRADSERVSYISTEDYLQWIHIGSRLVHNEYFIVPQYSACQTDQLPLAHAEVGASVVQAITEPALECADKGLQLDRVECLPQLLICLLLKGIQIVAQCAREEHRILWYDRDATAQIVESQLGNVVAIDLDEALVERQSKERLHNRRLARPRATHNANLLHGMYGKAESLQHIVCPLAIAQLQILKVQLTRTGPLGGQVDIFRCFVRWLRFDVHILQHTFHAGHLVLQLHGLSHAPLTDDAQRHGLRDGQTDIATEVPPIDNEETEGDQQNVDDTDQIRPEGKGPIDAGVEIDGGSVLILIAMELPFQSLGGVHGAYGGQALERGVRVRVDGTASCAGWQGISK